MPLRQYMTSGQYSSLLVIHRNTTFLQRGNIMINQYERLIIPLPPVHSLQYVVRFPSTGATPAP